MADEHPFFSTERRPSVEGPFLLEEVQLANRNCGVLLEALRYDLTPAGLHYLLNHFDVPYVAGGRHGRSRSPGGSRGRRAFRSMKSRRSRREPLPVTLECAGNGRGAMSPRYPSMPWISEAVGTAEWTGTPLRHVLDRVGVGEDAVEIAFIGADRGFDRGIEHAFGRSLKRELALERRRAAGLGHERGAAAASAWLSAAADRAGLVRHGEREMADAHRGAARSPSMASSRSSGYHYRSEPDGPRTPVTHMRVKSLLVPPGIPGLVYAPPAGGGGHDDALRPRVVGRRRADRAGGGGHRRRLAARPSSIRRRASLPGAAGVAYGTREPANTSCPAARPMPMARRSRWRRAGMPAASATTPCTACG